MRQVITSYEFSYLGFFIDPLDPSFIVHHNNIDYSDTAPRDHTRALQKCRRYPRPFQLSVMMPQFKGLRFFKSFLFLSCLLFGNSFIGRIPSNRRNSLNLFGRSDGGSDQYGPPPVVWSSGYDEFEREDLSNIKLGVNTTLSNTNDNESENTWPSIRGGATKSASSNDIVKESKGTSNKMTNFWKSTIGTAQSKVKNAFKSKEQKRQEELMNGLKSTRIRAVTVPNSTVLPPDVIRVAVKRSGLIGSTLRTDRVQEIALNLKRWYMRKGYILHSVTGAILKPETATAEITVQEPKVAEEPVKITVCKEMVVDEGKLLSFRQYREKHAARRTFGYDRIEKKSLNTTFVPTEGRTKPSRIAKALRLMPGKPFQWDAERWGKIVNSGIFSTILRASPERTPDGTVVLEVYATEPPPRHLEYGIAKSLYTGTWEGEIDFEHQNLFGGGETVGLMVRRGTKDAAPSVRLRYSDERFGLEGGYDFEVFTDFLGGGGGDQNDEENAIVDEYSHDSLLDRKGATFRLRNPINPKIIRQTAASASFEQTSTRTGLHENIGSASLTLGPVRKLLPMDARSSFSTTLTGGSRFGEKTDGDNSSLFNTDIRPYSSISATTRQILPLSFQQGGRKPFTLALQHTIATSTFNLPRHEARAMGIATQIRGASPDGSASSSLKGTAEVRVPLSVPKLGSGSIVVFGDWFYVQKDGKSPFYAKSSIGVGIRKYVQGFPLKYDICYSSEGKIKSMFGLGPDFDA